MLVRPARHLADLWEEYMSRHKILTCLGGSVAYVSDHLVGSGKLTQAAIIGLEGGVWATSDGLSVGRAAFVMLQPQRASWPGRTSNRYSNVPASLSLGHPRARTGPHSGLQERSGRAASAWHPPWRHKVHVPASGRKLILRQERSTWIVNYALARYSQVA